MKYVLFAALLATLSAAQASDADMEVDCATRPYVGACQEDDLLETAEIRVLIEPKNTVPETDCSTHPYVGICDMTTEN